MEFYKILNCKDAAPEVTINKIRNILNSNNIFPYELMWTSHFTNCHAVRLGIAELPGIGVNGKGINRLYALASAYGEFMERLQCGMLIKSNYGLMQEIFLNYPDWTERKFSAIKEEYNNLLKFIIKDYNPGQFEELDDFKIHCAPYYNVKEHKVDVLPETFLSMACGSNGLCAGNTPEEALVQGISEVVERYVAAIIQRNAPVFPDIPLSAVKNATLIAMFNELIQNNYTVIIKDFTIGGAFPCAGLVLINKDSMKYAISLGAHPCLEIALQRCATEAFQTRIVDEKMFSLIELQGMELPGKEETELPLQENREIALGAYTGSLDILKNSGESTVYRQAFQEAFTSNKDSLRFLIHTLEKRDFRLYIRDCSYLGFPSYKIYAPGMSEIHNFSQEDIRRVFLKIPVLKKYFMNLKKTDREMQQHCAELLESMIREKSFTVNEIYQISHIVFNGDSDFMQFTKDPDLLLALLNYNLKNYTKAYKYLRHYLDNNKDSIENISYFTCALCFFRFMTEPEVDMNRLKTTLQRIFGEISEKVIDDLTEPADVFRYYALPECGNCAPCPAQPNCCYAYWKQTVRQLNTRLQENHIDQNKLGELLGSLR